jgi:hypothetical protein
MSLVIDGRAGVWFASASLLILGFSACAPSTPAEAPPSSQYGPAEAATGLNTTKVTRAERQGPSQLRAAPVTFVSPL